MAITQTYSFDTPIDYALNNTQISGGKAKLAVIDLASQVFAQPFASDSGFTYDNTKAEFSGGLLRQKDQRPTNAVFGAKFTTQNENWSNLVGTLTGTAAINAGKLECLNSNSSVIYTDASIGNIGNKVAFKFKVTPNYSGAPSTNRNIFSIEDPAFPSTKNTILLMHSASGATLRMQLGDASALVVTVGVSNGSLNIWSPVAGTTYEFEFNLDTDTGTFRLFIDGVLHSSKLALPIYTRTNTATRIRIGAGYSYASADYTFDDFVIYNAVQHTANYTPGYSLPETIYVESSSDLPTFNYAGLGDIQVLTNFSTTQVGSPRFTLDNYWHDGIVWSASDGSYIQANTVSEIVANIADFPLFPATLDCAVVFPDSNTLSSIDQLTVTYTGEGYSPTGYLKPGVGIFVKALTNYSHIVSNTANTDCKVILEVNGELLWWNGSVWATSNGTIAQANTAAEIAVNVASLTISPNKTVYVRWLMSTSVSNETPELDIASITYNFGGLPSSIATCEIYGYLRNISNVPIANATMKFSLNAKTSSYSEANGNIVSSVPVQATTDSNGYFTITLLRSSEFEEDVSYKIEITAANGYVITKSSTGKLLFYVPDQEVYDITELLPIAN